MGSPRRSAIAPTATAPTIPTIPQPKALIVLFIPIHSPGALCRNVGPSQDFELAPSRALHPVMFLSAFSDFQFSFLQAERTAYEKVQMLSCSLRSGLLTDNLMARPRA